MNTMTKSGLVAAIAALAVTPILAKSGGKHGTNILHFNARVPMVNDDTTGSNNATGTVAASQATQGNADKETLTVSVKGLQPNSPYSVFVSTSASGLADVDDFSTDRKGNATLKFTNGKAGKKNIAISSNDVPVSTIQEVDVEDTNGPLLTAEFAGLTNATSLQFLVKQDISENGGTNGGGSALLQVKSTLNKGTSRSSVTVTESGLQGGQDYVLVFNGTPVATNAANSKGKLKITSTDTPPDILDLTSVDVTDTNGNPVSATATLP